MSIVGLLIVFIIVGAGLYLLQHVPIDETIKRIIYVIVIVVLVIYAIIFLASLAGLGSGFPAIKIR